MPTKPETDPLRRWMDALKYRGPVVTTDEVIVKPFVVSGDGLYIDGVFTLENLRLDRDGGRGMRDGTYHKLVVKDQTTGEWVLWMSDTTAEVKDHVLAYIAAKDASGGRGLINGLGLGCVLGAWLDVLDHVDVVETDKRIIDAIGPFYTETYGDKVTIHHADAYNVNWRPGTTWDVAWHDIWPTIDPDSLPDMTRLKRKYANRVGWQGCWAEAEARWFKKNLQDAGLWVEP